MGAGVSSHLPGRSSRTASKYVSGDAVRNGDQCKAPVASSPAAAAPAPSALTLPPASDSAAPAASSSDRGSGEDELRARIKMLQAETEALRSALQGEQSSRTKLAGELAQAEGSSTPGTSKLSMLKRRNLGQMPLREALPEAASYLKVLLDHRSAHEAECDLLRRVCELLQSSRLSSALTAADGGEAKEDPIPRREAGSTEAHINQKLRALEEQTQRDTEMKSYIMSQFVSETTAGGHSLGKQKLKKLGQIVIASNRLRRGSMDGGPQKHPDAIKSMNALGGTLTRQQSMVGIPARHLPSELSDDELDLALACKAQVDRGEWGADVLSLGRVLTMPMSYIVSRVLKRYSAASTLGVSEDKLMALLVEIELGMRRENPYHNHMHAADVAYTTHLLMEHGVKASAKLSNLQCVTAVLAAATHDLRHPGVNNNLLMHVRDEVAIVYNDRSVLENMHICEFFRLVRRPELNIFCQLSRKDFGEVRKALIAMVLATDMAVHFEYLAKFKAQFLPADRTEQVPPANEADQQFLMKMMLHAADISNPTKPMAQYFEWTDRVLAEFYAQGDKERDIDGLDVSPFFDRAKPNVPKCQSGFIGFIVRPLFEAWVEYIPSLRKHAMPHVDANAAHWVGTEYEPTRAFIDEGLVTWDPQRAAWVRSAPLSPQLLPLGVEPKPPAGEGGGEEEEGGEATEVESSGLGLTPSPSPTPVRKQTGLNATGDANATGADKEG